MKKQQEGIIENQKRDNAFVREWLLTNEPEVHPNTYIPVNDIEPTGKYSATPSSTKSSD